MKCLIKLKRKSKKTLVHHLFDINVQEVEINMTGKVLVKADFSVMVTAG